MRRILFFTIVLCLLSVTGFAGEQNKTYSIKANTQLDVLTHDKWFIRADNMDRVTLKYTSNDVVCFLVNDIPHLVRPVKGVSILEITANEPGPIVVKVRGIERCFAAISAEIQN